VDYRQKLESQRDLHRRLAQWEQACEVQELLARAFPGPRTWADLGALLQRLGRWEEAAAQYQRLPEGQALRHYQTASLLCARGGPEESLLPLLRAMTLDRSIADALVDSHKGREAWRGGDYWSRYGQCWDDTARKYFLAIYQQSLVKMALGRAQRLGTKPRRLFRECAYPVILDEARRLTSS
jgi:hypothetical protein